MKLYYFLQTFTLIQLCCIFSQLAPNDFTNTTTQISLSIKQQSQLYEIKTELQNLKSSFISAVNDDPAIKTFLKKITRYISQSSSNTQELFKEEIVKIFADQNITIKFTLDNFIEIIIIPFSDNQKKKKKKKESSQDHHHDDFDDKKNNSISKKFVEALQEVTNDILKEKIEHLSKQKNTSSDSIQSTTNPIKNLKKDSPHEPKITIRNNQLKPTQPQTQSADQSIQDLEYWKHRFEQEKKETEQAEKDLKTIEDELPPSIREKYIPHATNAQQYEINPDHEYPNKIRI